MVETVTLDTVEGFAATILDPERSRPLIAVTTAGRFAPSLVDPEALAETVAKVADVALVPTGDVTWRLSELLPPKLDVYGGAVRIWWPHVSTDSDPYDHPLFFVWDEDDARRVAARVRAAVGSTGSTGATALVPGTVVEVEVGDVVPYGAFVTTESGRKGLVHISELKINHPSDVVERGDVYRAAVLWDDDRGLALSFVRFPDDHDRVDVEALRGEVRVLAEDRRRALEELGKAKDRVRELERRLREVRSAVRGPQEEMLDEAGFLARLRESYDARYTRDDQARYPLREVRLGPQFLERVRRTEGVELAKVVEVAADIVARRAHEIPAREVHPLRSGEGGAPQRTRAADGAQAWRCALQVGSASARRLHWWELRGGGVELASVGVHDDVSIPD